MQAYLTLLLLSLCCHVAFGSSCNMAEWSRSFDDKGYSNCNSQTEYLNGLWRNKNKGSQDWIYLLENGRCCPRDKLYHNQPTGCFVADWRNTFDRANSWGTCPKGYFINGLYRSPKSCKGLNCIELAKCCKPASHPHYYGKCYDQDVSQTFDKKGLSKCNDGYFMTGIYKGGCDQLSCLEKFRCCKMFKDCNTPTHQDVDYGKGCPYDMKSCLNNNIAYGNLETAWKQCGKVAGCGFIMRDSNKKYYLRRQSDPNNAEKSGQWGYTFKCHPPTLTSMADVKTRVMDVTMSNLATLAHYLGYAWCASCYAQWVGEDFRRNGDSWEADTQGTCKGYKATQRLKMHYDDFHFSMKSITYGKALIEELQPEAYYSGVLRNDDPNPADIEIERTVTTTRTVTHTVTTNWQKSHDVGIEISYSPPDLTGGVGGSVSYNFGYENGETTTDSEDNKQTHTFKIKTSKTVPGNSRLNWKIMLAKTRNTVPYRATIITKFSAELDGFLRWGGGYNGDSTNYHNTYRGSESRPTIKYKFGEGDMGAPFYEDLKRQSQQNQAPWQWNVMMQKYPHAESVIASLTKEGNYEFILTGKFEDVMGNDASIHYYNE